MKGQFEKTTIILPEKNKFKLGHLKSKSPKRIHFSFINDLNPPQNNVQIFPTYPFHKAHLQADYSLSCTNVPQIPLPFLKPTNLTPKAAFS